METEHPNNQNEPSGSRLAARGVRPPIVAAVWLIIAIGFNFLVSESRLFAPNIGQYIAILFFAVGLTLSISALRLFHRRETTHDPFGTPSALATTGPFIMSRNPMYLGVAFLLSGIAFWQGAPAFFVAPIGFIVTINYLFIPNEERLLERLFEDEYRQYQKCVRRWL